jgi:hypothetical protein
MAKISEFIYQSACIDKISNSYITPELFQDFIQKTYNTEQDAIIRQFITENTPYIFKDKPILYIQIVQYLTKVLAVNQSEIKLIGSAKTGFSLSAMPSYGKPFYNSDLDFAVYNKDLINKVIDEFEFIREIHSKKPLDNPLSLSLSNLEYWKQNIELIPRNIKRGFIDLNKMPKISLTPISSSITEKLWLIQTKLYEIYGIKIKMPSIRIYKDENTFF